MEEAEGDTAPPWGPGAHFHFSLDDLHVKEFVEMISYGPEDIEINENLWAQFVLGQALNCRVISRKCPI